jgi:anti-sigma factor RsiW
MKARDDMELMLYLDGELSPEEEAEVRARLADDPEAAAVVESLGQMRDTVQTHLELSADDADPRLDRMWGRIERVIGANGAADHEPATPAAAPARPRSEGVLASLRRWLGERKSHVATGAVAAGAALAVALIFFRGETRIIERPGPERIVQVPAEPATPMVPVKSEPAAVEELSVNDGTGYILTIPGEGDDNDTTVIWIEPEESEVEGPI